MSWTAEAPATILVIDDDFTGREAARRALTRAGHTVLEAATIDAAWPQIPAAELAIIDVNLPDGNGLDLTRTLRAMPRHVNLAILQTSALAVAPRDQAAGLDAGADAYLVHPVSSLVLTSTAAALLRLRRTERALADRERQLRSALDAGGVCVARIDLSDDTITAADGLLQLIGTTPTEPQTGVSLATIVHPDDIAALHDALNRVRDGDQQEFECRLVAHDHRVRRVLWRAWPVHDDDNLNVIAAQSALVDITSRRAIQDQLALIDRLVDRANVALELSEFAQVVLREVQSAWHADIVVLGLLTEPAAVQLQAIAGIDDSEPAVGVTVRVEQGLIGTVTRDGQAQALTIGLTDDDKRVLSAKATSAAAVPIRTADGYMLGVLAVAYRAAREVSVEDLQLLTLLGERLAGPFRKTQLMADERALVVALQQQLLPQHVHSPSLLHVTARYVAGADRLDVGGDWYDCIERSNGEVILLVGDVTGKGAPAAAVMGRIRAFTQALAESSDGPAELLAALNTLLYNGAVDEMATLCCLYLSADRTSARAALAGHPPPLLLHNAANPDAQYLTARPGLPLGASSAHVYREKSFELGEEWTLLLYSDGLIERREQPLDRGFAVLAGAAAHALASDVDSLADSVLRHCAPQQEQPDDVALLVARRQSTKSVRITIPADARALGRVRRDIRRWATLHHVDTDALDNLLVCVGEAASNSIQHAYGLDPGNIQIDATVDGNELTLRVRDWGRWRTRPSDGHGLDLIAALSAHEIIRSSDGTLVTMRLGY